MTHRNAIAAFALILLSGCAAPAVDRETAGFDAETYSNDLDVCRGGTVVSFTLKTVGGTFVGATIGAANGVLYGALTGDGEEGAIIGAIVGGGLGFGVGARSYLTDQWNTIDNCLREKGYDISTS